jgi:hypothetical protein
MKEITEAKCWCYTYRAMVSLREECQFYVSLAGHPQTPVLMAIAGRLTLIRHQNKNVSPEMKRDAVERALLCRGIPVAPGLVDLYLQSLPNG